MSSVKLTHAIKTQILSDVLKHRFLQEHHELSAELRNFAITLYRKIYGKDWELMQTIPEGWLPKVSNFAITVNGRFKRLYLNGWFRAEYSELLHCLKDFDERAPQSDVSKCLAVYDDSNDEVFQKVPYFEGRIEDLNCRVREAATQTRVMLDSVTTLNRLEQVWEEVKPFTAKHHAVQANLPVVQTQQLNALLGLPKEEQTNAG